MKGVLCVLLLSVLAIANCESLSSFPALFFSEQLVPGLKDKFHQTNNLYTRKELSSQLKYSLEDCVADSYFIIDQPDLKLSDFQNFTNFGYLRAYMSRASSIQAMPNVLTNDGKGLDLNQLNDYIELHCQAKTHKVVNGYADEVPHYIDTKKRVIRINFKALPEDPVERDIMLADHDEVFRDIVRRLPSPHYFVLYTTGNVRGFDYSSSKKINIYEEYPEDLQSLQLLTVGQKAKLFENSIFPDITLFDKTREVEFERNTNVKQAKSRAEFFKPRLVNDKLLDRDFGRFWNNVNEIPDLFDKELLKENALVILLVIGLVFVFGVYKLVLLVIFGLRFVFAKTDKQKND